MRRHLGFCWLAITVCPLLAWGADGAPTAASVIERLYFDRAAAPKLAALVQRWGPQLPVAARNAALRAAGADGALRVLLSHPDPALSTGPAFDISTQGKATVISIRDMGAVRGTEFATACRALGSPSKIVLDLSNARGGDAEDAAAVLGWMLPGDPRRVVTSLSAEAGAGAFVYTPAYSPCPRWDWAQWAVVIGPNTGTAAAVVAYDAKFREKAPVVGSIANPPARWIRRVSAAGGTVWEIPVARLTVEITSGNWEGRGVKPTHPAAPQVAVQSAASLLTGPNEKQ